MPQTRFVPGGRIVEEFIPDAVDEGYQGFSGDRPMLAFDMFGQINTGDPKIELARRMAAQRHDEAEAQATAQARFDEPRFVYGASEQPDSVAAIDRELFQPIRRQYGIPEPAPNTQHQWFKTMRGPNGEVITVDTRNNSFTQLTKGKEPTVERPYTVKDETTGVTAKLTEGQYSNFKASQSKLTAANLIEERKKLASDWNIIPSHKAERLAKIANLDAQIKALGFNPETGSEISTGAPAMSPAPSFTPQTNSAPVELPSFHVPAMGRNAMMDMIPDAPLHVPAMGRRAMMDASGIESGIAVPWNQMPIPGPSNARTSEAVPWGQMPIPDALPSRVREVIRITPSGRRAIFDANTRKFLRYAP